MYKKTYSSSDFSKSMNIYHKVRSFRKATQISGISKSTICRWWTATLCASCAPKNSLHCLQKRQRLQRKKKIRKSKYIKILKNL